MRRFGRDTPGQWEDMKPGTYSYGDLLKMTLALGRLVCKISRQGEHIGLLMPNMVATAGLLIGTSAFGRVPCMLNYTAGGEGMLNACSYGTDPIGHHLARVPDQGQSSGGSGPSAGLSCAISRIFAPVSDWPTSSG